VLSPSGPLVARIASRSEQPVPPTTLYSSVVIVTMIVTPSGCGTHPPKLPAACATLAAPKAMAATANVKKPINFRINPPALVEVR
jgi:hypothetical protein